MRGKRINIVWNVAVLKMGGERKEERCLWYCPRREYVICLYFSVVLLAYILDHTSTNICTLRIEKKVPKLWKRFEGAALEFPGFGVEQWCMFYLCASHSISWLFLFALFSKCKLVNSRTFTVFLLSKIIHLLFSWKLSYKNAEIIVLFVTKLHRILLNSRKSVGT